MDVWMRWKGVRTYFSDGAYHNKLPFGPLLRHLIEQFQVKSFVEHTIKAKSRMRNVFLVFRIGKYSTCLLKMFSLYATGEGVNVNVLIFFCLVEAVSSCENNVRFVQ